MEEECAIYEERDGEVILVAVATLEEILSTGLEKFWSIQQLCGRCKIEAVPGGFNSAEGKLR